ncbi:MAG: ATP-binding cassette domain-containing protein [Bacilli bacterium]|nr:ATP-binding cassette domain-containing protein [Bacilli bacterium]
MEEKILSNEENNAQEKPQNQEDDVIISVRNLTKDYGKGRGIFDISFDVKKGTVFGYCGTNGSGKTTTLRHIMGFIKPDKGEVKVKGLDAWKDADEIKKYIGYLPGEIAFPQVENGSEFLKIQAETLGLTDMSKAEAIINALQLDPTANLKRMSKGMKQKTAIVAAFMHSPEIIILDEPTTGLDPLMRDVFVNIIKAEKARGATIIMSNHMFDELEETCDYVGFIKDGHLIDVVNMADVRNLPYRDYVVTFEDKEEYDAVDESKLNILDRDDFELSITIRIDLKDTKTLIEELMKRKIKSISEKKHTLEEFFMNDVGGKENE